jgi:hypothetical protein
MTRKTSRELLDELMDYYVLLAAELFGRGLLTYESATPESKTYLDTCKEMAYQHCFIILNSQDGLELSDSDYSAAVETIDAGRKAYRKLASIK